MAIKWGPKGNIKMVCLHEIWTRTAEDGQAETCTGVTAK